MRYATWEMTQSKDNELLIPKDLHGGQFFYEENRIAGYIDDDCNPLDHILYNLKEITQAEFEDLAQKTNGGISVLGGKIVHKDMSVNIYIAALAEGLSEEEARTSAGNL